MVVMNSGQRIGRNRRTEKIIRLEITNGFPKCREKFRADLQTSLSRRLAVWQAQQLELVAPDVSSFLLLPDSELACFFARSKMVTSLAVGADQHPRAQLLAVFAPEQLERAGRDEFKIVKMCVDRKDLHN